MDHPVAPAGTPNFPWEPDTDIPPLRVFLSRALKPYNVFLFLGNIGLSNLLPVCTLTCLLAEKKSWMKGGQITLKSADEHTHIPPISWKYPLGFGYSSFTFCWKSSVEKLSLTISETHTRTHTLDFCFLLQNNLYFSQSKSTRRNRLVIFLVWRLTKSSSSACCENPNYENYFFSVKMLLWLTCEISLYKVTFRAVNPGLCGAQSLRGQQ